MLEHLLARGDVLTEFNFRDNTMGGGPGEVNWGIRDDSFTRLRTTNTKRFKLFKKTTTHSRKCYFRFLPYVQGKINYCECQGVDVLSGFFSGCIMARYKKTGGSWRVCHVSTGAPNDCQGTWTRIQQTQIFNFASVVTEFKPHLIVTGCQNTLGLITSIGGLYAIGCEPFHLEVAETRTLEEILASDNPSKIFPEKDRRTLALGMLKQKKKVQALRIQQIAEV